MYHLGSVLIIRQSVQIFENLTLSGEKSSKKLNEG